MAAPRWLGLLNFALLLLIAELRPLGAQTTNLFAGTFDEVFSNGGKVTPIFTRPDAPALPTSRDVSPPSNPAHQHADEAGEHEGPASALAERLIAPAQTASTPAQSRSEALQLSKAQAIATARQGRLSRQKACKGAGGSAAAVRRGMRSPVAQPAARCLTRTGSQPLIGRSRSGRGCVL